MIMATYWKLTCIFFQTLNSRAQNFERHPWVQMAFQTPFLCVDIQRSSKLKKPLPVMIFWILKRHFCPWLIYSDITVSCTIDHVLWQNWNLPMNDDSWSCRWWRLIFIWLIMICFSVNWFQQSHWNLKRISCIVKLSNWIDFIFQDW